MLELKNIVFKRDNKTILDHVNLRIEDKKFVVITGPNGGGKSTLAKIIMGIEIPDEGQIFWNGEDITKLSITERAKRGIGFAFQQPVRFKGITVHDLINLSLGKKVKFNEACQYLSEVGLCPKDYMNREVNASLSGGELKRIEIATVAAKNSILTIFDEPEAGIDLWSFQNLIKVFEKLYEKTQGSVIIISHQERILEIANQIILISNGKIKQSGAKDEILPKLLSNTKSCRLLKEEEHV